MSTRKLTMSFAGGEVTPEFWGQLGDAKFQAGLALCRNMIVLPHGPVANRPGFAYVNTIKIIGKRARLIPFTYSNTQTMVLEFGEGYIRFHTQGSTLLTGTVAAYSGATAYVLGDLASLGTDVYYCTANTTGNTPPNASFWYSLPSVYYEIPSPYVESELPDIHYVQSADVLTLVHPNHAPRELRRYGATRWVLVPISFVSLLTVPGAPTVTPTGSGATSYRYKVTSVGSNGLEESAASGDTATTNNLLTTGNYNTISWSTTAAPRYNVYKQSNGLYGFIGQTDGLSFVDDNITANLAQTPPITTNPFSGANLYPGAVSYFEQRRCFAGSTNEPQNLRMTRSGTESNLNYSIPTRDDDSINVRVAAREANMIRHIVPLGSLVLLTGAAEWRVTSVNSDALTPSSISVKPQSYVGANNTQPVIVNTNIIFVAARGGHVREMTYSQQANNLTGGYLNGDLSLRAPHLFDNFDVVDMAYSKAPSPVVWMINSDGKLLGLTYVPEQQLGAWHRHDGEGFLESCCVVAEGAEDVLYVTVKRFINGAHTRYLERLVSRQFATLADAFFVDSGATYSGAATTTIGGLTWLEGETVNVLGDGAVFPPKVVSGGSITLEQPCTKVHVGLPILAQLQTLPLALQVDAAFGQGRLKNINQVWLRVYRSSGVLAGPSLDRMVPYKQRTVEPYGTPPALRSDEISITLTPSWQSGGQIFVQQLDPLPMTIVSMTVEAELGG